MQIYFCPEFINDLKNHNDRGFARRALKKVVDDDGGFPKERNDHRYEGIEDAWIRYISQGSTAFRVIYIQKGDKVYLYRAGNHDVEDHLSAPKLNDLVSVDKVDAMGAGIDEPKQQNYFFTNYIVGDTEPKLVFNELVSRRLIPHKDVYFVTPNIDLDMLAMGAPLGRLINSMIEDGANFTLVTTPPTREQLPLFEHMELRGANVLFCENLSSRLYLFIVSEEEIYKSQGQYQSKGIIGSARLSTEGVPHQLERGNEELCFALPPEVYDTAEEYVLHLMMKASDLRNAKTKLMRN